MAKARIRTAAKASRDAHFAALTPAERCAAAVMLAERVMQRLTAPRIVAVYLPIGSECDPLLLIDRLEAIGVRLALPHVTGRRGLMRFLAWTPGDPLPAGPMGLRQPLPDAPELVPDTVIVPLLAFDAALHRLGYGAGHYDRALVQLPNAQRIGLGWEVQRVDALPVDSWDVPLHAVATETQWYAA